ncbi:hypothetical protein E2C01_085147 [Portunus trituberculatus]|uniref:Uncharacterized protein n=1 Tax=Portunus trituberculatus TaxID=210409 RepID=A0A5B7JCS4_PORTR|nr:hypothetical protein [Portunus trituberculatus]
MLILLFFYYIFFVFFWCYLRGCLVFTSIFVIALKIPSTRCPLPPGWSREPPPRSRVPELPSLREPRRTHPPPCPPRRTCEGNTFFTTQKERLDRHESRQDMCKTMNRLHHSIETAIVEKI